MAAIGRTSLVGGGRQAHLRQSQQQGLGWLSSAVSRAKSSRCPNAYAFYVVSLSSHRAVLLPCGSWACVHCGRKKKEAARLMIEDGIARARARGHRVRFITLTSPSRQGLTMRELYVAFNRLRTKLRRSGHLREYFAVVETTQAGALHLHVLATGRYLPQRELSKAAAAAGFGRVADIRAVTGTGDGSAGAYLVKTLAGYATKANAARLATRGARRLRPVRTSRAWYPGGMAEAEREVGRRMAAELSLAPDPGPWLFVVKGGDGALHVRSQAAPLVLLTTGRGRCAAVRRSGDRPGRTGTSGERRPKAGARPWSQRGTAMRSPYERGLEALPHIAAHQLAWCALGRARLDGPLKPSAEYERALNGLLARFLASDSLPSAEAFAETVQRCLDELAGAHAAGTLVPVERDRAWRRAARWLAIADEHAQATLP